MAIVSKPYSGPGGIQTCLVELVGGLNARGIVPNIVWDEPFDLGFIGANNLKIESDIQALAISSSLLRSLPAWLAGRLSYFSRRYSDFGLQRYDFVYNFMPEVRIPPGVPNLCYVCGPGFLTLPDQRKTEETSILRRLKRYLARITMPGISPDPNANYVTLCGWIAELWYKKYGVSIKTLWPPMRKRVLSETSIERSGFLFLSRIVPAKNPESMLALAEAFPSERITIAGVVDKLNSNSIYVETLRKKIKDQNLQNVEIIENPAEADVAKLFSSHEYFVFPAAWEHFGIVTVEAIRAGLIPIVHDSGGQREIVPHTELKYSSEKELIVKVGELLNKTREWKGEVLAELYLHAEQGVPERYVQAMLSHLEL